MKSDNLTAMARAMLKAGIVAETDLPRPLCRETKPELVVIKDLLTVPFEEPPNSVVTDKKEPPPKPAELPEDDGRLDTPRVRGRMVWLHKTAPILEIEGRPGLTPEEMAAGRRR
jgi:hypothetical protein